MRYRRLGSSDLVVSEIALGTWLTFGGGIGDAAAGRVLDTAFELGITLVDTANVYNRGAAESLLGDLLHARPRGSYVLATKLYFPMSDEDRGLSREQVFKQLDASLARLRTDYVDLYQCHRYDAATPLAETMEALSEVVRQGKVRYLGFSEWSPAQIRAARDLEGVERFVSSQPEYSMLHREPEGEVFELCQATGISQIVWSPLAQGVLTGKYGQAAAPPRDSRARSDRMGWAMGRYLSPAVAAAVEKLRPIAESLGLSLAQLALAWVLREPNVAASGVELDAATLAAIDDALSGVQAAETR
jgi:aryl-alcohol dehydrogenase-like predicted oxidoreductase